jgi:hypothetical protein
VCARIPKPYPSAVKHSNERVTLFQNEKVSKERQNTKASTFDSEVLEDEGDVFFQNEKVSKERKNIKASTFDSQALARVTLFQKEKVPKECHNTKASTFDSQPLDHKGDTFSKRKSFNGVPEYQSLDLRQSST